MSVPKQLAKRVKMERKRRRKQERELLRKKAGRSPSQRSDSFDTPGVVFGAVGGVKMSNVLEEFAEPATDATFGRNDFIQLYSMAQTAWNIALEPRWRHEAMIDESLDERLIDATPMQREMCRELLSWLVTRKLEQFSRYQRPILAFQLDELDDGSYYLSVMSGLVR
jgi:hypothetical protein